MCVCDIIDPRRQRVPYAKLASECNGTCTQQAMTRPQIPGADCLTAKARVKPGEINLTVVKEFVRGRVEEMFKDHGFISYTLEQRLWESTVTKNGAPCLPNNNGKIFFHRNEVCGGIKSLTLGQAVEFDLVHLKSNNKIIANRVYHVEDDDQQFETDQIPCPYAILNSLHLTESEYALQLGHFQNMSLSKMIDERKKKEIKRPKITYEARDVTGRIVELFNQTKEGKSPNQRYALLMSTRYPGQKLFMHVSSLIQCDFNQLKIGDLFRFSVYKNNHNKRLLARNCEKLQASKIQDYPSCAQAALSHFQFMEPARFTDDIQSPPFVKIASNIQGLIRRLVVDQNCGFLTFDHKNASKQNAKSGKSSNNKNKDKVRIFFHAKDLFKLRISELKEGQKVTFNLYQNSKNQKYIAKEVTKTTCLPAALPESLNLAKDILANSSLSSAAIVKKRSSSGVAAQKIMPKPVTNLLMDNKEKWDARRRSVETLNLQSKSNSGAR